MRDATCPSRGVAERTKETLGATSSFRSHASFSTTVAQYVFEKHGITSYLERTTVALRERSFQFFVRIIGQLLRGVNVGNTSGRTPSCPVHLERTSSLRQLRNQDNHSNTDNRPVPSTIMLLYFQARFPLPSIPFVHTNHLCRLFSDRLPFCALHFIFSSILP